MTDRSVGSGASMRAMRLNVKEIVAVIAGLAINVLLVSQLVGGLTIYRPTLAFAQPYGNGLPCTDDADCIFGNCEQDVCCDRPCNGTTETCNQPGSLGVCTAVLPAPALSWPGQILAAAL